MSELNENRWVYELKATHQMKVEKLERQLNEARQKNNHLADEISVLNEKIITKAYLENELMEKITKLRFELNTERNKSIDSKIDKEMLSRNFFKNVS